MTTNPYANFSIVTVQANSDGQDVSYHYIFGHECPHADLQEQLKLAVARWLESEDAAEYAESNWPATLDWVDVLGNMPSEFFTDMELIRLDQEAGDLFLDPDEELVPEHLREKFLDLALYGPEGEASLQGEEEGA
jgi:hypothetical protein